jgi:hypothetical protein
MPSIQQIIARQYRKVGWTVPDQLLPKATARSTPQIGNGDIIAFSVTLNMRTCIEANTGGRFKDRLGRKKQVKQIVQGKLGMLSMVLPKLPAVVTLTRIGKCAVDDDNLAHSFKNHRDSIAAVYGVDDGSPLYRWAYAQEKGDYAVRIEIRSKEISPEKK